jgi:hypothetical protein
VTRFIIPRCGGGVVMADVRLTDRELAVTAFILSAALEDEEPGELRAAMMRALRKLRAAGASDYDSRRASEPDAA